ncbi:hypothetical protein T484DRAFT_1777342 [Baffinella frigidus]|nr:hypothetical protein T484DRAFT_1777342 [Cryptophyta sp. CCMP2293]
MFPDKSPTEAALGYRDFTHLDEAFSSGDLSLENAFCPDEKVYLFGCTEPQMIMFSEDHTEVLPIPVIVAVRTEEALPEKLGLNSANLAILPLNLEHGVMIQSVRTEEALPEKLGLNSVQMCAEQGWE